jgi:hypothetical protein
LTEGLDGNDGTDLLGSKQLDRLKVEIDMMMGQDFGISIDLDRSERTDHKDNGAGQR